MHRQWCERRGAVRATGVARWCGWERGEPPPHVGAASVGRIYARTHFLANTYPRHEPICAVCGGLMGYC
jgi:hypothetical protein